MLDELDKALASENYKVLIEERVIDVPQGKNKLFVQQIWGWLFSFCIAFGDYQSYDKVNWNALKSRELINREVSLENIKLRNAICKLQRNNLKENKIEQPRREKY